MTKLGLFLCLTFVILHLACAETYGTPYVNSNQGQTFTDPDGHAAILSHLPDHYLNNELQSQPAISVQPNLETVQFHNVPEQSKTNNRGGLFGLFRPKTSSPPTGTLAQVTVSDQPSGYLDSAQVLNNTADHKERKTGFQRLLPWNWGFHHPSAETQQQPRRSWFLPRKDNSYASASLQTPQCYCVVPQSQPLLYQSYPSYVTYLPDGSIQIPNLPAGSYYGSGSNVRQVPPSNDFRGFETNPLPIYVRPPTATGQPNVANSRQPIPQPQPGSTGAANEQPTVQQPAPQQDAFGFNSINRSSSSSTGEAGQSSQTTNAANHKNN